MAARHPARAPPPSIESIPASDDRNRAHLAACRHHTSKHSIVQWECRLNCRLGSKSGGALGDEEELTCCHVTDRRRSLHRHIDCMGPQNRIEPKPRRGTAVESPATAAES